MPLMDKIIAKHNGIETSLLIYLIGFAGTGKYSTALELQKLFDAVLVDNHLINNPIFSIINPDGTSPLPLGTWREVEKVRQAVFNAMCYLAHPLSSFILTNELIEKETVCGEIYRDIVAIADARKSIFVPVRMVCEKDELLRRVVDSSRRVRYKSTNFEKASERYDKHEVMKVNHENLLEMDVTKHTPTTAALEIEKHIQKLIVKGKK